MSMHIRPSFFRQFKLPPKEDVKQNATPYTPTQEELNQVKNLINKNINKNQDLWG